MRYAKATDRNHAEIRDGLRRYGYLVRDCSVIGHGMPDLCVTHRTVTTFMPLQFVVPLWLEVKDPKKSPSARALTEAESFWGPVLKTRVVLTLAEALEIAEGWP